MSLYHDYRYALEVSGADDSTLKAFHSAFDASMFGTLLQPSPENAALYSTDYAFGRAGFFEEALEDGLHQLALQFPQLTLTWTAEDLDDSGHGYTLILKGDSYQRSDLVSYWSDLTPPTSFDQRKEVVQTESLRRAKVMEMVQHLCKQTDYDLLFAQKQALLKHLASDEPIPQEALHGLIHFLDHVGDLGETLGRFQYDGIEPPFPMLPEYQKQTIQLKSEADTLQHSVHHLYERMLTTHNQNPSAFYIATNLAYLARIVEKEEDLPLETLYQLAARLYDAGGSSIQPLLNEERLDALRYLLEYGVSAQMGPAFDFLEVESMPEFLLQCSNETFLYLVERTAYFNQEKYSSEIDYENDPYCKEEVQKDMVAFQKNRKQLSLNQQLSDAEKRYVVHKHAHPPEHEHDL